MLVALPHLEATGGGSWSNLAVIVGLFVAAWIVSRLSSRIANLVANALDRRHLKDGAAPDTTAALRGIKRRDTTVSLIRTSVRYVAFGTALVLSVMQLVGFSRATAIAGASLAVLLVGFAGQRFLTDLIAGFLMAFEGWFAVGDTVTIEPNNLSGVVEEVSLRATTLRAVTGETIRINNSAIAAATVISRGVRNVEIELFVTDEVAGRALVEEVSKIMPAGPTRVVVRPWVDEVEVLDDELVRLMARAAVAPGREWLVNDFFSDIVRERAPEGLVEHGPVVMYVDDSASRRFARSQMSTSRRH